MIGPRGLSVWLFKNTEPAGLAKPVSEPSFFLPSFFLSCGGIAQLEEHLLCKQGVVGSSPSTSTTLDVSHLGQWDTPFWQDGEDKGPKTRAGFLATTMIDRNDFGVSWNGELEKGGVVAGKDVFITIDVEALLEG